MKRDASPFRYFPWFARDVALFPLSLYAVISALFGFLFWRLGHGFGGRNAGVAQLPNGVQGGIWRGCLTIAVLLAIGGVVGIDIQRGYYRTWFSKPMAPWWYYLQRFVLGAVVLLIAPYLLGVALELSLHSGYGISSALIGNIALGYLLVGSACLLLSIFHAYGWLLVFILGLVQGFLGFMMRGLRGAQVEQPWALVWLHRILPPFDLIDASAPMLRGEDLLHVIAYGTGMLIIALALLRYRPLGSGGRA